MKKTILTLLCFVMAFSMTACGKKDKLEGNLIIEIHRWPSDYKLYRMAGDSSEKAAELHKESWETYWIYSSGEVGYRIGNDDAVDKMLSDEDLKMLLQCYDRMCEGNVTIDDSVIPDLGYTYTCIEEYNEKQEYVAHHDYQWSSVERCKELGDVLSILYPYFEHPAVWGTDPLE